LLLDMEGLVDREGPPHQRALFGWVDRLGATAHAPYIAPQIERGNIAANGGLGRSGDLTDISHRHDGTRLDSCYDHSVALCFVQGCYLPDAVLPIDFNHCQSSNRQLRKLPDNHAW